MFKPYQQVINFALQEYNSRVQIVKGKDYMSLLFIALYSFIFLAIFAGIIFLQKYFTKKHIWLGLILPLLSLCYSLIIDTRIISMIYYSYLGPRTIEKYNNGLLIQKSTISTQIQIPSTIFALVMSSIPTIILFAMFIVDCNARKRA